MAEEDCGSERSAGDVPNEARPVQTGGSHDLRQSTVHQKRNRARGINRVGYPEPIAYEPSLPDSSPGNKRCQSRPSVRSSWLLQVKWQS